MNSHKMDSIHQAASPIPTPTRTPVRTPIEREEHKIETGHDTAEGGLHRANTLKRQGTFGVKTILTVCDESIE